MPINIIVKKSGSAERSSTRYVASNHQREEMKDRIRFHEAMIQNRGSEDKGDAPPRVDPTGHIAEINTLKKALEDTSPIAFNKSKRDEAAKKAEELDKYYKETYPIKEKFDKATGESISALKKWYFGEHIICGQKMTGEKIIEEKQKIERSLGIN